MATQANATSSSSFSVASGQQATGWLQNASFPAMPAPKQPGVGTTDQAARRECTQPAPAANSCCEPLQAQHSTKVSLSATGLRLQQAAEQLLPSSSSDSEAEATGDQQDLSGSLVPPGRAGQATHLDSGSDEASHRKHKRRRESTKHKKHKKHRSATAGSPTPACCARVRSI